MADVLPRLPERGALIRFLAERPALPLHEAADLLGWSSQQLVENLRTEEAFLPDGTIQWSEVAYWLLDVWPRAILLKALGNRATLIPRGLHLQPVPWNLPIYQVSAIEDTALVHHKQSVH